MSFLIENCRLGHGGEGSVYVRNGVIHRVSEDTTQAVPIETKRIEAGGNTLLPGLADTHCHPFELGWLRRNADLRGAANMTGLRMRLLARVQKAIAGEWVFGMGWDQEALAEGRFPRREDIDDLTPANPVILTRVCGHVGLVNSRAIEVLGLESAQGEEYPRNPDGTLTGIIKERGLNDAFARIPRDTVENTIGDILVVEYEAAKSGLTTLHCILSQDGFAEELDALARLRAEDRLLLRYRVYVPYGAVEYVEQKGLREKLNDDRVRLCGVKFFADGSLGARTAALRKPYSDDPGNSGILRYRDEELATLVTETDAEGYQVIIHAIGDRAVEQAIDALSLVTAGGNPRRHRIEHASLAPKDLRARISRQRIGVAVQPQFVVSDTWARARLGEERIGDLYPFRSMFREGIVASGGSDAPVETMSPIIGMWAAMTERRNGPGQTLSSAEATDLYTRNAAFNGLEESETGKLSEGYRADMVLLDSDIKEMHPAMLRKVGTAMTFVGGNVIHSYDGTS